MSDEQIQSYFDDLNARIDHLNSFVTYALDAVSKQRTEVGLLKQMMYYLNDTVNSELRGDKMYEIMMRNSKAKTDDSDGDKQGDLLSRLNSKDKMDD